MTLYLSLTNSEDQVMIDKKDYWPIIFGSWSINKTSGYVMNSRGEYLHVIIASRMKLDTTNDIDHIDRNKLNCQRENLRSATRTQNLANMIRRPNHYKGVFYDKERKKFKAQIKVNYKAIFLGRFDTEQEAALEYNKAALKYFGEFALLNKVEI